MAHKNTGNKISIEASRKALFAELEKNCSGPIVQKTISFSNDDVPNYLKVLKEIEEKSKEANIIVK